MKSAAAGGALIAASAPAKPLNKLISQVEPDPASRPGTPVLYATTCRECPAGCGMHAWNRDGRVVKAEGNPTHTISRGGLCARGQAALQGLYDPDRLTHPLERKKGTHQRTKWTEALQQAGSRLAQIQGKTVILSNLQSGGLAEIFDAFADQRARSSVLYYEPVGLEGIRRAHEDLFGRPAVPDCRLEDCDVVLSLCADFLETWLSPVRLADGYSRMHSPGRKPMGRMIYVGPRRSMTAANADTCLLLPPHRIHAASLAILHDVAALTQATDKIADFDRVLATAGDAAAAREASGLSPEQIRAVAGQLAGARRAMVLAGPATAHGPWATEIAKHAALMNLAIGAVNRTVDFARPHAFSRLDNHRQIRDALSALGPDDALIVHEANPAFTIPALASALEGIGLIVCLDTMMTETTTGAHWIFPVDSPLESWGDCEPIRGIHCLQQPAMGRLHNTRNAGDVLLKLAEKRGTPLVREKNHPATYRQWLEERWTGLLTQASQEKKTRNRRDALRHGVIEVPVPTPQPLRLAEGATLRPTDPQQQDGTYVWTYPSIFLYDGRGANRGWLQEAPDPMSTVVWGSWVDVNPQTARELGLSDNSGMGMRAGNEAVEAPARITDDVAPNVVALPLGQGHSALGRNARKRGVNGFVLTADAHGAWAPATLSKSARTHKAVACSATDRQFERDVLQWIDAAKLARMKPGDGDDLILPLPEGYDPERDMYPKRIYEEHRWAMVIDLQRCNGCGACAVACYAENNIPVVGKQNVAEGREMAWLKVVPYRAQNDTSLCGWLPMLCQHCDAAPCEPVCPVFASVHNEEGLNAQVYNRCVGTRYCSNNCPYKVRRFNWINTTWQSPLDKQLNPEVSARCRGVMEKCTFCIQRIRAAEFTAKRQNRDVRDGEIRPACAQSCPTRAIVFGDLLDPHSRVSKLTRNDPRRYHVLEEINTKPAVTYLRRIAEKPRVPET